MKAQSRLELIRLVYRHDRTAEDALAIAVKLESYVFSNDLLEDPVTTSPGEKRKPGRPSKEKSSGNPLLE